MSDKTIFEKTMAACLEDKRVRENSTKKTTKKVTEAKKPVTKKTLREEEEIITDEVIDDVPAETEMDDIVDDVVVVVDPEISEDELSDMAQEAQEAVEDAEEGEIATLDEYIGDLVYTCPICGNTFFSDHEMQDGEECPVCGDFPTGYAQVGEVASAEEAPAEEEVVADEVIADEEELEPDIDDTADIEEVVDEEETLESRRPVNRKSRYSLDESTFNPFMNKFIRENYRNAKSFEVVGASLNKRTLSLECKITMNNGKNKKATLKIENFKPAKNMILAARDAKNTFKCESKSAKVAPFIFKATMNNKGVICCEGFKYNFVTTAKKEGKRVQVSGNLARKVESRKSAPRARRNYR